MHTQSLHSGYAPGMITLLEALLAFQGYACEDVI